MVNVDKTYLMLTGFFALSIALNIALWSSVRTVRVEWRDVPPTPSVSAALWSSLGDRQLAYRSYGTMIQNMGYTGGTITSLKDYDYNALGLWFRLAHKLDPKSDFMPLLAGYAFGSLRGHPEKLPPIIDYLELAAGNGEGQKWRFMGQAAFLARFKMNDMDRALELARKLAAFKNPDMASWARQMPVFILNAQGEKEAAYAFMLNLLKTESHNLHPNEVNATLAYICEQILDEHEAAVEPLCSVFH